MKINEVEQRVGITRKNIRFYEDQKLLHPERNLANGYRDYSEEDVEKLYRIKLLRKLAVPIEEIRNVFDGNYTLKDCMEHHQARLSHQKSSLDVMQKMCAEIAESRKELAEIDVNAYLDTMDEMEKGGEAFVNITKTDRTVKKAGAITSAVIMSALIAAWDVFVIVMNCYDPIPTGVVLLMTVLPSLIIVGIVIALIQRIREIEGGEEDEARKY